MSIEAIVWDCDGVLIDSEIIDINVAAEIINEELALRGKRPLSLDEFLNTYFSKNMQEALFDLGTTNISDAGSAHVPNKFINDIFRRKAQKIDEILVSQIQSFLFLPEILTSLKRKGLKLAAASNSSLNRIMPCLKKHVLEDFFKDDKGKVHIYSVPDSFREVEPKPAPDIYNQVIKELNVKSKNAIAIEDTPTGVQSASKAGLKVIGFCGGSHIPFNKKASYGAELLKAGATKIIFDYREFENSIREIEPALNIKLNVSL